jgi:hypothetical protein
VQEITLMAITSLGSSPADTIVSNLYTEQDRKRAIIEEDRARKAAHEAGRETEGQRAEDRLVDQDLVRYEQAAMALVCPLEASPNGASNSNEAEDRESSHLGPARRQADQRPKAARPIRA